MFRQQICCGTVAENTKCVLHGSRWNGSLQRNIGTGEEILPEEAGTLADDYEWFVKSVVKILAILHRFIISCDPFIVSLRATFKTFLLFAWQEILVSEYDIILEFNFSQK